MGTELAIVLGAVGAFIVIGLTVWLVPQWEAMRWQQKGITDEAKLAELTVAARTTLTQAIGGIALVATLAVTAYQVNETRRGSRSTLRLSEQGQITDRYARAVEQLDATDGTGRPATDVRVGALFSLLRIGMDSDRDAEPALRVVVAFTRNNIRHGDGAAWQGVARACVAERNRTRVAPAADLQTALSDVLPPLSRRVAALPNSTWRGLKLGGVDFTGVILDSTWFEQATLTNASFRNANLTSSSLHLARLDRADLRGACLHGADLSDASLRGADLRDADLSRANLHRADLSEANLRGASLYGANLRDANLGHADLGKADLREADLLGIDGANLTFADLRDAQLQGAFLADDALAQATTGRR